MNALSRSGDPRSEGASHPIPEKLQYIFCDITLVCYPDLSKTLDVIVFKMNSNARDQNRLLILILGILLVAASFYTLSIGAIKPNPEYIQWLMDKQQVDRDPGGAMNKTAIVPEERPPRTIYKITTFNAATILITLPSGVVLIVDSIRPGLINRLSPRTYQRES